MGWTGQYDEGWTAEGFVRNEFHNIFIKECELVDVAVNNKREKFIKATAYVAYKNPEGKIVACVILMERWKKQNEFLYKVIDETWGPVESKCPKRILKLLDPTDNERAIAWRNRCGYMA